MKKIVLICNMGISTSMLVKKMQEEAGKQGVEVDIKAMPEGELITSLKIEPIDAVLLGPQVSYAKSRISKQTEPYGVLCDVIPPVDYGMMNGAKVLKKALELAEQKK